MNVDLEKLLKLDMGYPGISFGYHSWALGAYLDSLDSFIDLAKEQYRVRTKHELETKRDEFQPEEYYVQKLNEIDEAADYHIPRYARMAAVGPLWGMFELTATDITKYVARRENTRLRLNDIRADNFIERLYKYYHGAIGIDLPWSESQKVSIELFYKIRNAVAHRNGQFGDESEERKAEIKKIASQLKNDGVSMQGYQLEISSAYVKSSTQLVYSMLTSLNGMVCDRYDGPTV